MRSCMCAAALLLLAAGRPSSGIERITINWVDLALVEKKLPPVAGKPAVLTIQQAVKNRSTRPLRRPSLVWLYDLSNPDAVERAETKMFGGEHLRMALQRFHCYRVDVQDMPQGKLRKLYAKEAPALYFFDPAGKLLSRVTGKSSPSPKLVSAGIDKAWSASFIMKLREYRRQMEKILGRLDRLAGKMTILDQRRARLGDRPNPAARRKLNEDTAKLRAAEEKILSDENKLIQDCSLRPEFQE